MRAAEAIDKYLIQVKDNIYNQFAEDEKDMIYTDIDFIRWLIDELNGDLNVDINIEEMFDIFVLLFFDYNNLYLEF